MIDALLLGFVAAMLALSVLQVLHDRRRDEWERELRRREERRKLL